MDQFGVLVESIGFKSQSRSTPLADLKGKTNVNNGFSSNLDFNSKPPSNSGDGSGFGGVFRSNDGLKTQDFNGFDDVFGGSNMYDLDSVFKGSNNLGAKSGSLDDSDDIFGVFSGSNTSDSKNFNNVFGKIPPPPKQNDLNDDLLGGFSNIGSEPNGVNGGAVYMSNNGSGFNDFIPGFVGSSGSRDGVKSERSSSWHSSDQDSKSNKIFVEDPFDIFESPSLQRNITSTQVPDPLNQGARKISVQSPIDELEEFASRRIKKDADKLSDTHFGGGEEKNMAKQDSVHREQKNIEKIKSEKRFGENRASEDVDVLESFFSMGTRSSNVPNPSSVTKDSLYDTLFQKNKAPANQRSGDPTTTIKVSPVINLDDDFSFLSGVEVAPPHGVFQEVKGESEERRRARFNHHQNTQERMIKALNEKNQRDRQVQLEQEERHRLAASLDDDIKRWASGKEGNLRALLSSLQYVLWPECGWRPVSLTDMITSISVKKVYQKATLCVHPDKVQQKGANIQQKYIAEKVFDVLKEAYNKFSSEEL